MPLPYNSKIPEWRNLKLSKEPQVYDTSQFSGVPFETALRTIAYLGAFGWVYTDQVSLLVAHTCKDIIVHKDMLSLEALVKSLVFSECCPRCGGTDNLDYYVSFATLLDEEQLAGCFRTIQDVIAEQQGLLAEQDTVEREYIVPIVESLSPWD